MVAYESEIDSLKDVLSEIEEEAERQLTFLEFDPFAEAKLSVRKR